MTIQRRNQRGNPTYTIRLPPEIIQRLKHIAQDTGSSVSALVRMGIDRVIASYDQMINETGEQ